jgi:hypothetical protein
MTLRSPGRAAQRVSGHHGPRICSSVHHLVSIRRKLPFACVSGINCEMPSLLGPASVPVVFYSNFLALSVRKGSFSLLGAMLVSVGSVVLLSKVSPILPFKKCYQHPHIQSRHHSEKQIHFSAPSAAGLKL